MRRPSRHIRQMTQFIVLITQFHLTFRYSPSEPVLKHAQSTKSPESSQCTHFGLVGVNFKKNSSKLIILHSAFPHTPRHNEVLYCKVQRDVRVLCYQPSYRTTVPTSPSSLNLITALFWVITQRVVVISYRRFGTTFRSHPQGSRLFLGP